MCFALGYGDMTTGVAVPNSDHLHWSGPAYAARSVIEEVHTGGRDRSKLSFPCFRTNAFYAFGVSGGPIIREVDGRVIGVVSASWQEEARLAYGAIFAAILGSGIKLPDTSGELCKFDFQALADNNLVDTDDVMPAMWRTDDGCVIVWADER